MLKAAVDSRVLLRALVTTLFVCSMAGLVLTMVFSFEEPHNALLLGSSALLLIAIVSVFAHIALTGALNRPQKRTWLRLLTGRQAAWAWAEYLSSDDLRAAAIRLRDEESARR